MRKVNTQTDIAIIGAGPCGSFSALTAAKLGAKVIVLEEHGEIGVPTHCTGHISLTGLKRLGIHLPPRIVENEFHSASLYSPSGKEISVKFDTPVTCVINRALFDKFLAELATRTGAEYVLNAKVKSINLGKEFAKAIANHKELKAKIVINAEGVSSILSRKAGVPLPKKRILVKAVQAEIDRIDDVDAKRVEIYFGQKFASGFFAWIVPKRDGTAKVGLATRLGNPKICLQTFMQKHPLASHKMRKSCIKNISIHHIPLGGPIPKTYATRFLIVGDAASQVKPLTGGGIITGLSCARIAGEVASEALRRNDCSERFLSRYEERWRETLNFQLSVMLTLRKMLNRLTDKKIDQIIRLCQKFSVDKCLSKVEDVDFLEQSLLSLMKNPSIFAVATYFLLSSLTSM